jgi:hypothetical protein
MDDAYEEFLKGRFDDLAARQREALEQISKAIGVEIGPDDVTPEIDELFAQTTAAKLRDSGDPALADRWSAAYTALSKAVDEFRRLVQHIQKRTQDDEPPTERERAGWDSIRDAAAAAEEEFERVRAEASAWFNNLDSKGDA